MFTKFLNAATSNLHTKKLGYDFIDGRSNEAPQLHILAQSLDEYWHGESKEWCDWIPTILNSRSTDVSRYKHREHQRELSNICGTHPWRRGRPRHSSQASQRKADQEAWICGVISQGTVNHETYNKCGRPIDLKESYHRSRGQQQSSIFKTNGIQHNYHNVSLARFQSGELYCTSKTFKAEGSMLHKS